ncbi:MAG: hypothetical protein PHW60_13395 [Kiritimatiellae bacterium]|nr:hypothetical protein [Kiritimatiellia bacterium]
MDSELEIQDSEIKRQPIVQFLIDIPDPEHRFARIKIEVEYINGIDWRPGHDVSYWKKGFWRRKTISRLSLQQRLIVQPKRQT